MGAVRNWADDNELKLFKKYHGQKIKPASLFDDALESDECHETTFVEVLTSAGFINFTAHNEHNGYYGGFYIRMRE